MALNESEWDLMGFNESEWDLMGLNGTYVPSGSFLHCYGIDGPQEYKIRIMMGVFIPVRLAMLNSKDNLNYI